MTKLILFSDLDGTLLDYATYSFKEAVPALRALREKEIPLVLCSSKTRGEILLYREKLANKDPFISENGGGIFIPKGYFPLSINGDPRFGVDEEGGYDVIRLGANYVDIRKGIEELRQEGFRVRGFGDMPVDEVAEVTGLSPDQAILAKERDFDEPFLFQGGEAENQALLRSIREKGFKSTQGVFHHLLGDSDKGTAVAILLDLYRTKFGRVISVALGDSPNDLPMLKNVDLPLIVQKPDGTYDHRISVPNLRRAPGMGPAGWNRAVLRVLEETLDLT